MRLKRGITLLFALVIVAVFFAGATSGAEKGKKAITFKKVKIKSGYLLIRATPSAKAKIAGEFYAGDDCAVATGESKKAGGSTWIKVANPYLRSTGWVDSKFMTETKSNCDFEKFLYGTRGKADWVFSNMTFPYKISYSDPEAKPIMYTKQQVIASTKELYDGPYYYLQLLDDKGMKRFWDERDGCAKYELIENKKYDVNSYQLYIITKKGDSASITISCGEMYPEFKFKKTASGYIMEEVFDSGS